MRSLAAASWGTQVDDDGLSAELRVDLGTLVSSGFKVFAEKLKHAVVVGERVHGPAAAGRKVFGDEFSVGEASSSADTRDTHGVAAHDCPSP